VDFGCGLVRMRAQDPAYVLGQAALIGHRCGEEQPRQGPGHPVRIPRQQDPQPLATARPRLTAETVESPLPGDRTAGSASGLGKRTGSNSGTAAQADSTKPEAA
jgi:hypothetical protein